VDGLSGIPPDFCVEVGDVLSRAMGFLMGNSKIFDFFGGVNESADDPKAHRLI